MDKRITFIMIHITFQVNQIWVSRSSVVIYVYDVEICATHSYLYNQGKYLFGVQKINSGFQVPTSEYQQDDGELSKLIFLSMTLYICASSL